MEAIDGATESVLGLASDARARPGHLALPTADVDRLADEIAELSALQIGRPFETLYGSTAVHLILGGALVLAAPRSRAPRALLVVGFGSFVTGLLELFLGVPLGRAGHDWSVAQGGAFLRICAVFILALGSGFTCLLWPRSSTA